MYEITERVTSTDGKYSALECWSRAEIYPALTREGTLPGWQWHNIYSPGYLTLYELLQINRKKSLHLQSTHYVQVTFHNKSSNL